MFKVQLENAQILKQVFESIKDFITDTKIYVSETGLKMTTMDSAHVSLVQFNLTPCFFDKYTCESQHILGLHLPYLCIILKCVEQGDSIELCGSEDEPLHIILKNKTTQKESEFQVNLIDVDADEIEIPETEPFISCQFATAQLSKTISSLSHFGDTCQISSKENIISFETFGDIASHVKMNMQPDFIHNHESSEDDEDDEKMYSQKFPMKYLSTATRSNSLSSTIHLELFRDCPISITYNIPHNQVPEDPDEYPKNIIKFYIAPKIEEDD